MSDPQKIAIVIMAGGAGTRFWPASTEARPKQFLRLFGERSMLQLTYDRIGELADPEHIFVLTSARFAEQVRKQLPELPADNVIGEPCRRDTAAAVALAALLCQKRFGDCTMAVLTADHHIHPAKAFRDAIHSAAERAATEEHALYTFGIRPEYAATGYGYLWRGESLVDGALPHYRLRQFREKPDADTAQSYVASGEYYWNSGMFVWSTRAILGELERQLPDHLARLGPVMDTDRTPGFDAALGTAFEPLAATSIDFGVMEQAKDVRCVIPSFSWSDVAGWIALSEHLTSDDSGNAHQGQLCSVDASNNIVFSEHQDEVIALFGVNDLVVVRSGNKTLVTSRSRAEEIKTLVQSLHDDLR